MANTPRTDIRVDREAIDAVRERHGLADDAPVSYVVRFALALAGGRDDAATVARMHPGPKRPRQTPKARAA